MKLLVCGGREYEEEAVVFRLLDRLMRPSDVLIEGGAMGADEIAFEWWKKRGQSQNVALIEFWIDSGYGCRHLLQHPRATFVQCGRWQDGKHAGPARNRRMLEEGAPDLVVAFPGHDGTESMVRIARKDRVTVLRVEP